MPRCHHTSRACLPAEAAEVFLHGLPLLVEEDRGPTALRSARNCPSMLPFMDSDLPDIQQPQQDAYQLGTTSAAPMQVDTTAGTHPPIEPKMTKQPPPAATAAVSPVGFAQPAQQAQQSQHAQQVLPTELAQHASAAAAAVPSSLHWGLFPTQVTMQGSLQSPGALPPSATSNPQQHQPEACEEMPEKAVPSNTTWMQLYSASGSDHGQGSFGQPSGHDCLAKPWERAVCAGAGAVPPALAQQDPHTGQWVPTLMPLNPFFIDQLAKTNGNTACLTGPTQPSEEGLRGTALANESRAVASKKRSRDSRQLPLSAEPAAPTPARAFPAVDRPVPDRTYQGAPAQLATFPNPPDCTAAASGTILDQHHTTGHAHQWHSQAQANGSTSSSSTHAWPHLTPLTPPAPGDVIDLCSPIASWQLQHQQIGSDPGLHETAAHRQLWQLGKQPTAGPGTAPGQPTFQLHKELTEFAVMASATQVGCSKHALVCCIS